VTVLDVAASNLVIAAPGPGDGYWAGGPSAVYADGAVWLAYRLRRPVNEGRGYANVVARSSDGLHFETMCTVHKDDLDTASLERPALVKRSDGGWRLYVSLSSVGSKHWRIDVLDADDPLDLAIGKRSTIWPGDEHTAVKDPVVVLDGAGRWHAWVCCHPLDEAGSEDRMTTRYAHSQDGLDWTWGDTVLAPDQAGWDRRGRRLTSVVQRPDGRFLALYDGRANAAENWYERTSTAGTDQIDGPFMVEPTAEISQSPYGHHTLRYASVITLPDGTHRAYFEVANHSGANEIRSQLIKVR
jgi:hypothetical protein